MESEEKRGLLFDPEELNDYLYLDSLRYDNGIGDGE